MIQTSFDINQKDKRDFIMEFVKTLTNTEIGHIRKTFIGGRDEIEEVDDFEKVDNTISFWIHDMKITYKMYADSTSNEFFVK